MCGRYTLTADMKKVADRFGAPMPVDEWATCALPRYNFAPTQAVIVVGDDGKRYMKQMRWGLIPSWAKDASIGNRMINARAETLAERPAFRDALKKRRCLIPADGFYEWQKLGKVKQPLRVVLKNREPFGFAGLWEHWKSPEGEEVLSCTIITTEASELLKPIHERMPVILTPDAEAAWLNPDIQDPEKLLPLLKQYPPEEMEFYAVSRDVNSPAVDKASNIERVEVGA
jgi:putative SOS response-associated peptidase YedK